jgi:hypothetical protein
LPVPTIYWVALLHVGGAALLSHETAGALWGLLPGQPVLPVHVTVPASRGIRSRRGLVGHRAALVPAGRGCPPRTTVCATALALCRQARRADEVTALLGRVAQRYPEVLPEVRDRATSQRTLRWRAEILAVLQDVAGGAHSALERRYLLDVEQAHALPAGTRQRAVDGTREDVYYEEQATVVELDGRATHQPVDAAWRDMKRDNAAAVRGETTLRYGWYDVRYRPCAVAAEVAAVLRARGWTGRPKPCGPRCPLRESAPSNDVRIGELELADPHIVRAHADHGLVERTTHIAKNWEPPP